MSATNPRGMTLVEVLIVNGLVVLMMSMVGAFIITVMKNYKETSLSTQRHEFVQNVVTDLLNESFWRSTVNLNSSMDCLKSPIEFPAIPNAGVCTAASGGLFDIYDQSGNVLIKSTDPVAGFTDQGAPCSTFPMDGSLSPACPFRLELSWRLAAPTQVLITSILKYQGVAQNNQPAQETRLFYRNLKLACPDPLILSLNFEEAAPGNPVGATLVDSSIYKNNPTVTAIAGGVNYVPGVKPGTSAIAINRLINDISASDSVCLQPNKNDGGLMISAWINFSAVGVNANEAILSKRNMGNSWADHYTFRLESLGAGNYQIAFCVAEVAALNCTHDPIPIALVAGTWYHVFAKWNGTQLKTYFNGAPLGPGLAYAGNIPYNTSRVRVGYEWQECNGNEILDQNGLWTGCGSPGEFGGMFNGSLDSIKLWRGSAMTDADILNLYLAEKP